MFAWMPRNVLSKLICMFLLCGGCITGLSIYQNHVPDAHSLAYIPEGTYTVTGQVHALEKKTDQIQAIVSNVQLDDILLTDRLLIFLPAFSQIQIGDSIRYTGSVSQPEPFEGFAYDRYLATKGVYAVSFLSHQPIVLVSETTFATQVYTWREEFIERIDRIFGQPHGALLAGLLIGEQRFSPGWKEIFLKTGTTHIVAASGYNVAIVTIITFGLLTRLRIRRQYAFGFLIIAILGYVLFSGGDAPVLRAGIMGICILSAKQIGRRSFPLNALLLTACVMLCLNPLLLRDDSGFQLSFLSTMGLIYLSPHIEKSFLWIPTSWSIRESCVSTISATIAALPVLLLSFGRFSLLGIVANLLILPWIPLIMLTGGVVTIIDVISPAYAHMFATIPWSLLHMLLFMLKQLASLV